VFTHAGNPRIVLQHEAFGLIQLASIPTCVMGGR
jgi:hypothetical protein